MLTADTYTNVLMIMHFKVAEATARLVLAAAAEPPAEGTDASQWTTERVRRANHVNRPGTGAPQATTSVAEGRAPM